MMFFLKNKNKFILVLFIFWISFFVVTKKLIAQENHTVFITSVQTRGTSANDDFIELYNNTCKSIDLTGWELMKRTKDNPKESTLGTLKKIIPAKSYYLWKNIENKNNTTENPDYKTTSYSLSDNYSLALFDKNKNQIDAITWGENKNPFEGTLFYSENLKEFEVLRRNLKNLFSIEKNYSPKNSSFTETEEAKSCPIITYSDKIYINELFPAPSAEKEEFIELYNSAEKDTDLSDWILRDSSKSGKYVFPKNTNIKATEFFVVYKKDFKFALNNSDGEKVFLFNPTEKEINRVEYSSSPKTNYSYSFEGTNWHWTSKATPDKENEFDEILSGHIKKDKEIYAGVYADFEAIANDNAKHFTWDFGDKHKSYLQKTRHKYADSGQYQASLKITGNGEENINNFMVSVKNFKKSNIKIIAVLPNPTGNDAKNEWLEIFNNTKKKINLKNWSVATGWKKLYNHPIKNDFIIKPNSSKKLTHNLCAFSLGNTQAKIELRYPNGKTANKLEYNLKNKIIAEDALYQKSQFGWNWIEAKPKKINNPLLATNPSRNISAKNPLPKEQKETSSDIDLSLIGGATKSLAWQKKQKNQITLLFAKSNIDPEKFLTKNRGKILGISSTRYAPQEKSEKAAFSFDFFWKIINTKLNQIILKFKLAY